MFFQVFPLPPASRIITKGDVKTVGVGIEVLNERVVLGSGARRG